MNPNNVLPLPPPSSSSTEVLDVETFRFTPITQRGTDKSTAISVEHYSLNRHLYHVTSNSSSSDDDDVTILTSMPRNAPFRKRKWNMEKGESSKTAPFVCEICTETKTRKDAFPFSFCYHSYCTKCIVKYVETKLHENVLKIRCPKPECKEGLLEIQNCRGILPNELFDRWGNALCEAVILADEKFYCPFKDCSALLIADGGEAVKESECPNCRRLFCAQCKVAWHNGIACEEFQKLNKDEREKNGIMLMQLANDKKWRRCPSCRFYVERSEGCLYMKCRCGHAFCYSCGALFRDSSHYCYTCKR